MSLRGGSDEPAFLGATTDHEFRRPIERRGSANTFLFRWLSTENRLLSVIGIIAACGSSGYFDPDADLIGFGEFLA